MSMMELILTQDVENLGRAGQVVRVRPGFGRNYLIPRGMALLATRGNRTQLEHHQRAIAKEQERIRTAHEAMAKQLQGVRVIIPRKAGEGERLFGSVSNKDVADAVAAQGIALDRKLVRLDEPIRTTGEFEVPVRFPGGLEVTLQVKVIPLPGK
jgi:large subunit ribosomal protein L9